MIVVWGLLGLIALVVIVYAVLTKAPLPGRLRASQRAHERDDDDR
jgi:hypothetical protein